MATPEPHATRSPRPWLAAVLSGLVPGAGQLYARRYLRAALWFSPTLLVAVGVIPLISMQTSTLISTALSPSVLWAIYAANIAAAVWRVASSIDAYFVARPEGEASGAMAVAVGGAAVLLLIAAPHLVIGRYTYSTIELVDALFVTDGESTGEPIIPIGTDADIVPDPVTRYYDTHGVDPTSLRNLIFREGFGDPDAVAVWDEVVRTRTARSRVAPFPSYNERVGGGRITILFAGGDAGPGRGGLRTDAMMVASIDTTTGKAALFAFPRNMGSVPLPDKFSDAFVELEQRVFPPPPEPEPVEGEDPPPLPEWESCECFPEQLNALYPFTRRWTSSYPNDPDPGMAALRDVLSNLMGLRIDYYALIDMAAFVDLVDAIGGVDVYVLQPLQAEVSPPREGDPWAKVDVDVGWNHLTGPEALAYARARHGSSDYARMERQRCMVKAVAAQATPAKILRHFPAIVDAITGSVVTDIPLTFLPDLLEAAAQLDFNDIDTVGFTFSYWLPERDVLYHPIPDVDKIRSKVRRVLAGQSDPTSDAAVSDECEV